MLDELYEKIKNLPADYGEIHYETVNFSNVAYSKDEIEAVSTAQSSSGNVRVLSNDGWGFCSFNEPLNQGFVDQALHNSRLFPKGKSTIFMLSEPVVDSVSTSYEIHPNEWTLKQKNDLVFKYNELLKHPAINLTKVIYRDVEINRFFVNTEGSRIKQTRVFTGISLMVMARDGSNVQRAHEGVGTHGGLELVIGLEEQAEAVKQRAIDLLKADKVEGGKYTVLLDNNLAGVFAHEAFGHLSEADFLYENPRMQEVMVLGREFGPEHLNILDDGSLADLAGYTPYDDEGVKAQRTYLIKNGKLNARLHSRETAAKMNEQPTGNGRALSAFHPPIVRMTNTFIDNGDSTFDEMLASIDDGIYALDMLGGMTNLEMFTFSSGYAYRIRNGKIGELIRDVNLSGNVFQTLKNVSMVGNDLKHKGGLGGCGKNGQSGLPVGTGSPHIVIKDVLVGGT